MDEALQAAIQQAPYLGGFVVAVWIGHQRVKGISRRLDRCERKRDELESRVHEFMIGRSV